MKNIGMLGCGKLGMDIAHHLIKEKFNLRGTTTKSENLQELELSKIDGFVYKIGGEISPLFFKDLNVVIMSIPISESKEFEDFSALTSLLENNLEVSTKLIFTSSIGVYEPNQAIINELDGVCKLTSNNFQMENSLKEKFRDQLVILRLGGLLSDQRHPIKSLAGRELTSNGNAPVNLVHHKDVARIVARIIEKNRAGETYNCVYPSHPTKKDYYENQALNFGLAPPKFANFQNTEKIVQSDYLMNDLDFEFLCDIYFV